MEGAVCEVVSAVSFTMPDHAGYLGDAAYMGAKIPGNSASGEMR